MTDITSNGLDKSETQRNEDQIINIEDLQNLSNEIDSNNLKPGDLIKIINSVQENMPDMEKINPDNLEDIFGFWEFFKSITSLSAPMALSFTFSFQMFLMTILLNYLSNSEDELAATNLIITMINVLSIIGMSPIFSVNVLASNKLGELEVAEEEKKEDEQLLEEKRSEISCLVQNGAVIATGLAIPVVSAFVFSKPILTNVFGQNDYVAQKTQEFLRTYSFSTLPLMYRMNFEQILFPFGKGKEAMLMALSSFGIGSLVAGFLGFGWLGIPKLGAQGIAIGYVVEGYLTALMYGLYLAKSQSFEKYHFYRILNSFQGRFQQLFGLLKIGASISISESAEMIASLSPALLAGKIGVPQQAALALINQYTTLTFLLTAADAQTNSQMVNKEIGGKKYIRAHLSGKYGLGATLIHSLPIPLFFAFLPQLLIISSTDKKKLELILKTLAPIISAGVVVDSVRYNIVQQLRVLKNVNGSTIISASGLSLGVLMSYLLGMKTNLGIKGVALGSVGGSIIGLIPLTYRWYTRIQPEEIKKVFEIEDIPITPSEYCGGFFSRCLKRKYEADNIVEDLEQGNLIASVPEVPSYGSFK